MSDIRSAVSSWCWQSTRALIRFCNYLNDTIGLEIDDRMIKEYGAVCGMRIGRGIHVLGENSPQSQLSAKIPHNMAWDRTRGSAVGADE
jgi:hypothetical protein